MSYFLLFLFRCFTSHFLLKVLELTAWTFNCDQCHCSETFVFLRSHVSRGAAEGPIKVLQNATYKPWERVTSATNQREPSDGGAAAEEHKHSQVANLRGISLWSSDLIPKALQAVPAASSCCLPLHVRDQLTIFFFPRERDIWFENINLETGGVLCVYYYYCIMFYLLNNKHDLGLSLFLLFVTWSEVSTEVFEGVPGILKWKLCRIYVVCICSTIRRLMPA